MLFDIRLLLLIFPKRPEEFSKIKLFSLGWTFCFKRISTFFHSKSINYEMCTGQITCWGEINALKGMKKGDKCIFSPHLINSMHNIPWLKIYKIAKKRLEFFIINYLGKKYKSRGGGKNINFKFNIHPWMCIKQKIAWSDPSDHWNNECNDNYLLLERDQRRGRVGPRVLPRREYRRECSPWAQGQPHKIKIKIKEDSPRPPHYDIFYYYKCYKIR